VPIPVQFARLIQSATGIILLSQVVIATSDDTEKLMDHVEGLLVATSQTQIRFYFSIFAASSNLHPMRGTLPAGAQWPGKRGLFRRWMFLMHGGSFPTSAGRDLGGVGLYAGRRDDTNHV
jgi:hypothetical protein